MVELTPPRADGAPSGRKTPFQGEVAGLLAQSL